MSRHEPRQEIARAFGATDVVAERGKEGEARIADLTDGVGADAVLECVGTDGAMKTAFTVARPGSTVGFVGVPHGVELPVRRMFQKNVGLAGGMAPVRRYLPDLLDRVLSGAIDPGKVFDLTLPMAESAEGYRAMDERRAIKVLLQPMTAPDDRLLLGPLLRYVDETSAAVWVETAAPAHRHRHPGRRLGERAQTFVVHDHHYALVELDGLEPGTTEAYTVAIDGDRVWPPAGSPFPDPVIATLEAGRPAPPGVRLLPHVGLPRREGQQDPRRRRPARLGAARRRPGRGRRPVRRRPRPGPAARPGALPRRPGLRRRDHRRDAGVHRVAARHRAGARGPSSRTTRSTPTSTSSRGPTPPTGGCCRPCRAR